MNGTRGQEGLSLGGTGLVGGLQALLEVALRQGEEHVSLQLVSHGETPPAAKALVQQVVRQRARLGQALVGDVSSSLAEGQGGGLRVEERRGAKAAHVAARRGELVGSDPV